MASGGMTEQKQTQVSDIQAPGLSPELEVSPIIKFPHSMDAHFPRVEDIVCSRHTLIHTLHTGLQHTGLAEPNL